MVTASGASLPRHETQPGRGLIVGFRRLDQVAPILPAAGGPLGSAYALQKLDEMRRHDYPAGFPVRLALKDLQLVREVLMGSGARMPVLDVVLERFETANADLADQDLAAIYELDGG